MASNLSPLRRNPDILACIANLSSDEVFTPPDLANEMLDSLSDAWAQNNDGEIIWTNKNVRFLDPCVKSGIFLREITRRLTQGLIDEFPDLQERVDHILTNQVFGIGITNLTSLLARRSVYCSKHANGEHSIAKGFDDDAGNIWFERTEHTWENTKCKFCGASQTVFDRGPEVETHAYAFIHSTRNVSSEIFGENMQFDVVIGNPPYQLASDGGTRDIPIYHHFVERAKDLDPCFVVMVIPSRWMATGLGLSEFRKSMLEDHRIQRLVDYERSDEVFPGVELKGGACYFVWNRDHDGSCAVTNVNGDNKFGPTERFLDEHDILVRDSRALPILQKVLAHGENSIIDILSVDKEFGWTSNFDGFRDSKRATDVPLYYVRNRNRLRGWIARKDIKKSSHLVDKWKVMVPEASEGGGVRPTKVLGPMFIAPRPSVCTQTYLFFYTNSKKEALSIHSYLLTKFVRFLIWLRKITQHATRSTYFWVPIQSWDAEWSDTLLFDKYCLSVEEIRFIEETIRPIE